MKQAISRALAAAKRVPQIKQLSTLALTSGDKCQNPDMTMLGARRPKAALLPLACVETA